MHKNGDSPLRINRLALKKYCETMSQYRGFLSSFFYNHNDEPRGVNLIRFISAFDAAFKEGGEGQLMIPVEDAVMIIQAYEDIACGKKGYVSLRATQDGGEETTKDLQASRDKGSLMDSIAAELEKYECWPVEAIPQEILELRKCYIEMTEGESNNEIHSFATEIREVPRQEPARTNMLYELVEPHIKMQGGYPSIDIDVAMDSLNRHSLRSQYPAKPSKARNAVADDLKELGILSYREVTI